MLRGAVPPRTDTIESYACRQATRCAGGVAPRRFCYDAVGNRVASGVAMPGIYEQHLDRRAANYAPLTPLSFIARTAQTWPQRTAVVHGARRYTWSETYARSRRLASALAHRGVGVGDTVAAMLANYATRERSLPRMNREFILPSPVPTQYLKGHVSIAFAQPAVNPVHQKGQRWVI